MPTNYWVCKNPSATKPSYTRPGPRIPAGATTGAPNQVVKVFWRLKISIPGVWAPASPAGTAPAPAPGVPVPRRQPSLMLFRPLLVAVCLGGQPGGLARGLRYPALPSFLCGGWPRRGGASLRLYSKGETRLTRIDGLTGGVKGPKEICKSAYLEGSGLAERRRRFGLVCPSKSYTALPTTTVRSGYGLDETQLGRVRVNHPPDRILWFRTNTSDTHPPVLQCGRDWMTVVG